MKKILLTALIFITASLHNACMAQVISADSFKMLVKNQICTDLKKYNLENAEVNIGNIPVYICIFKIIFLQIRTNLVFR